MILCLNTYSRYKCPYLLDSKQLFTNMYVT